MKFLLDTNVVSELRRKEKCHPGVLAWQAEHDPLECCLSVISLMELKLGIEFVTKRDGRSGAALSAWYERRVKPAFSGRILPVTQAVAEACASLHAGRPRPFRDALIAATAQVHELAVVTRNVEDFSDAGISVVNPWL
jgi:predicted nucleic acid-binding protein